MVSDTESVKSGSSQKCDDHPTALRVALLRRSDSSDIGHLGPVSTSCGTSPRTAASLRCLTPQVRQPLLEVCEGGRVRRRHGLVFAAMDGPGSDSVWTS